MCATESSRPCGNYRAFQLPNADVGSARFFWKVGGSFDVLQRSQRRVTECRGVIQHDVCTNDIEQLHEAVANPKGETPPQDLDSSGPCVEAEGGTQRAVSSELALGHDVRQHPGISLAASSLCTAQNQSSSPVSSVVCSSMSSGETTYSILPVESDNLIRVSLAQTTTLCASTSASSADYQSGKVSRPLKPCHL